MKLQVLMENQARDKNYRNEHGLSLYIEHYGQRYLLDAGESDAFLDNAQRMGVDIAAVDAAILSHAHNDHAGGLPAFCRANHRAPVYLSVHAKEDYCIRMMGIPFRVGVPNELFEQYADRLRSVDGLTEIGDGVFLVPNAQERVMPLGKSSRQLLVRKAGKYKRDWFAHELSLVFREEDGLVILTGCGHNGIVNMVEHVMRTLEGIPVRAVIGGFHLMGFPLKNSLGEAKETIREMAERLKQMGVERIFTAHCTGEKAFALLREVLGDSIRYLHAGDVLEL